MTASDAPPPALEFSRLSTPAVPIALFATPGVRPPALPDPRTSLARRGNDADLTRRPPASFGRRPHR